MRSKHINCIFILPLLLKNGTLVRIQKFDISYENKVRIKIKMILVTKNKDMCKYFF